MSNNLQQQQQLNSCTLPWLDRLLSKHKLKLNLSHQLLNRFVKEDINETTFFLLTEDDFKQLQPSVTLGARRAFLTIIARENAAEKKVIATRLGDESTSMKKRRIEEEEAQEQQQDSTHQATSNAAGQRFPSLLEPFASSSSASASSLSLSVVDPATKTTPTTATGTSSSSSSLSAAPMPIECNYCKIFTTDHKGASCPWRGTKLTVEQVRALSITDRVAGPQS